MRLILQLNKNDQLLSKNLILQSRSSTAHFILVQVVCGQRLKSWPGMSTTHVPKIMNDITLSLQ